MRGWKMGASSPPSVEMMLACKCRGSLLSTGALGPFVSIDNGVSSSGRLLATAFLERAVRRSFAYVAGSSSAPSAPRVARKSLTATANSGAGRRVRSMRKVRASSSERDSSSSLDFFPNSSASSSSLLKERPASRGGSRICSRNALEVSRNGGRSRYSRPARVMASANERPWLNSAMNARQKSSRFFPEARATATASVSKP